VPIYDFECPECKQLFEHFLTIAQCEVMEDMYPCPVCGASAKKVIVLGHGGYLRPDSQWIRGAAKVLSDDDRPLPIENTTELRRYLEAHPHIKPKESHPAIPSRLGDCARPETEPEKRRRFHKEAEKRLTDMRSISISSNQPATA
jgi:putative FmdB family regulatory protein